MCENRRTDANIWTTLTERTVLYTLNLHRADPKLNDTPKGLFSIFRENIGLLCFCKVQNLH